MRKIDKIIIHCTATPEGRIHTAQEIGKWHRERGYSSIGYHYVIGLNGEVRKGRDESIVGAHTKGYNSTSIGVCYVGGVDRNMRPKDTRTQAQNSSLTRLVKELKRRYPDASIHGHNEFAAKACPSFDVKIWMKNVI